MNSRAFTLSLVIAGFAMLMVHSYLEGERNSFIKEYGEKKSVVIAKEDIKEFEILDERKVTTAVVPKKFKLPGSFSKVEELQNTIALTPILKGEQITAPRIDKPGGTTGLSRHVDSGKRAISIRVAEEQSVSKLIKPGDRVDILAQIDYAGGRKDLAKVKTILQDVLVLSTGLSITNSLPVIRMKNKDQVRQVNLNNYTNYNTVTLQVDPYQAQRIIFIMNVNGARPFLTLRNNTDKEQVLIKATRLFDVLDDQSSREAKEYFQQTQNPQGRK